MVICHCVAPARGATAPVLRCSLDKISAHLCYFQPTAQLSLPRFLLQNAAKVNSFTFDGVYDPTAKQRDIYDETARSAT
jgi:hypothetical protein